MRKRFLIVLSIFFLAACTGSEVDGEVLMTSLTGYQVVDLKGDAIAQVEDVLLAADSGQISYAVLGLKPSPFHYSKAAFTTVPKPYTAVPWNWFTIDSASRQLQLQANRATLYAAPLLAEEPTDLSTGWDRDIQSYWRGVAPMMGMQAIPEG